MEPLRDKPADLAPFDAVTPDLAAIEVFLVICEAGSVTAAARRLGLTQPAVSQTLRRLETGLDVELIDRRRRPLRLTPAGEALEQRGRELVLTARRVAAAVREVSRARLLAVHAGFIDSFAATAGPAVVRTLSGFAEHLSVWSGIAPVLGSDFLGRKLDFLVTTDTLEDQDGLERHLLLREPFVLVLPRKLTRPGVEPRLDSLVTGYPFIRYSLRSRIGAEIERYLRRLRLTPRRGFEFDATESVFAMVAGGVGWGLTTPLCLLQGRSYVDRFTVARLPGPPLERSLYLVAREGELPEIVSRAIRVSRQTLGRIMTRELPSIAPWARREITIGESTP